MTKTHSIGSLFSPSGCLTQAAIKGYLMGTLPEKDHASVEEHLASCPLCRDAMEGFSVVKDPGKAARDIASLNKRILRSLESVPPSRSRHVTKKIAGVRAWTYAAVAAVVILFIGAYFLVQQARRANQAAEQAAVFDTSQQISDPIAQVQPSSETAETQPFEKNATARVETSRTDIGSAASPSSSAMEGAETDVTPMNIPETEEPAAVAEHKAEETIITQNIADEAVLDPDPPGQDLSLDKAIGGVVAGVDQKTQRTTIHESYGQDTEAIFTIAEQMPQFPGGDDSLAAYIRRNLLYPLQAVSSQTEGTVYVAFVINKKGIPENAVILRGIGSGCDEEALRLVNAMPPWIPGTQRGKPIRVQYTLPIRFNIPE